jgi:hypothetical protein
MYLFLLNFADNRFLQLLCFWTLSIDLFVFKDNVLETGLCLHLQVDILSWAQSIELVPISRHQHQHKIEYINQAQHKPSARVKANINNLENNSTHLRPSTYVNALFHGYHCYNQSTIRIEVIYKETNGTNMKTQFSHIIYTGCSCSFLDFAAKWEFRRERSPSWVDLLDDLRRGCISCISCMWCLVQSARPSLHCNVFCCLLNCMFDFSSRPWVRLCLCSIMHTSKGLHVLLM